MSRYGRFNLGERARVIHWIGGRLGPSNKQENMKKTLKLQSNALQVEFR